MANSETVSLQEWFGFKYSKYHVDPKEAKILAFNEDFILDLTRRSERYLVSATGPKFVILEVRGDGKTHAINYVMNDLSERNLVVKINLDCPPMTAGAKYSRLHKSVIAQLNENNILFPLFSKIWSQHASEDTDKQEKNIMEEIGFEDLAQGIITNQRGLVSNNDLLRYLMAESINSSLANKMNVIGSLDVHNAVRCLKIITELYYKLFKKIIVLIIDEADTLKVVKQNLIEFKEAFRLWSEIHTLGFVFIHNVGTDEDMRIDALPTALKEPGVVSRIGSDNYMFRPYPMKISAVRPLIVETNRYLRGKGFDDAFKKAKSENPKLDKSLFPFSEEAMNAFEEKIKNFLATASKGSYLLPRSVLKFAENCCSDAVIERKKFVDAEIVNKIEYSQAY